MKISANNRKSNMGKRRFLIGDNGWVFDLMDDDDDPMPPDPIPLIMSKEEAKAAYGVPFYGYITDVFEISFLSALNLNFLVGQPLTRENLHMIREKIYAELERRSLSASSADKHEISNEHLAVAGIIITRHIDDYV